MGFPWPGEIANELSGIRNNLGGIRTELAALNRKVDRMSEQQAELNVDVTNLTAVVTDVSAQTATLGTDLASIAAVLGTGWTVANSKLVCTSASAGAGGSGRRLASTMVSSSHFAVLSSNCAPSTNGNAGAFAPVVPAWMHL